MAIRIACIGSRNLNAYQTDMCEKLGSWIVRCGHILDSGNAPGADQAFARGANLFRPNLVHLHLPWCGFNRKAIHSDNVVSLLEEFDEESLRLYTRIAEKHHPVFQRLSQGARKLMVRNSSILLPLPDCLPVTLCLTIPSDKKGGGGTGQGMRIAKDMGIKLVDLRGYLDSELHSLCEKIARLGK